MVMAFMQLPTELLQQIIPFTLPEGFESLALTCKFLYTLCTPILEYHNNLRFHYRKFEYLKTNPRDWKKLRCHRDWLRFPDTATSAYSLISRIATEPVVGRYILEADFSRDGFIYKIVSQSAAHEIRKDCDEAVRQLFANSSYLREAGLDWNTYYSTMMEDVNSWRQSEYAAAFVLTLLPNLEVLPTGFPEIRSAMPQRLLTAILQTAGRNSHGNNSLAQLTAYDGRCDIPWFTSLLTLPRIKKLHMDKVMDENHNETRCHATNLESTLEVLEFFDAAVVTEAVLSFLKHAVCLKSLTYWYSTKDTGGQRDWDLCGFIAAVQHEVGSHLEHFGAITLESCLITPGKPDLRGFERLQSLELPLEIVLCSVPDLSDHESLDSDSLLGQIVPASVSVLSLISLGKTPHDKALELLFRDFGSRKQLQTPNLKEISLTCPNDADGLYKAQCVHLAIEAKRAGVNLTLSKKPYPLFPTGLDEEEYIIEEDTP